MPGTDGTPRTCAPQLAATGLRANNARTFPRLCYCSQDRGLSETSLLSPQTGPGSQPRRTAEKAGGLRRRAALRGRGERKVSQKPRPLAAAGAPALGPRGVPRPPRRSVAFVVPGAPWRSGRALRQSEQPACGRSARVVTTARRPVAARLSPAEGGRDDRGKGGGEAARHGGGGERRWRKQRCPGPRLRDCVLPTGPAEPAGSEESMVRNLAAD